MPDASRPQVAIVDYGMGNLFSVKHACERAGMEAIITAHPEALQAADAVILPGVGAFGDAMEALARLDLVGVLRDIAASQKPMVGICLGMQLLMTESYEFGRHRGLDIIGGQVVRLRESPDGILRVKVPHVGWNCIHPVKGDGLSLDGHGSWKDSLLAGLPGGSFMYFVHSFYAKPVDPGVILSTTRYGQIEFCSSIRVQNVFGCQFHPERSGPQGLKVYQNLGTLIQRSILGREDVRETAGKVRTT